MHPIAITGGIGSGKSTVANLFAKHYGIDIVCADKCARDVIQSPSIINALKEKFGHGIFTEDTLDRAKLRAIIANDSSDRLWLNNLMHPAIGDKIRAKLHSSTSIYTIVDIPLLTRDTLIQYPYLEKIICVQANLETKVRRIAARDNQTTEQVLQLINSQITDDERKSFSDFIIDNNDCIESLVSQIHLIHMELLKVIAA